MEQQNKRTLTHQCPATQHRLTSQSTPGSDKTHDQVPLPQLIASNYDNFPSSASTASLSQDPLSNSEPSLRFPLPVGNLHLANWISSSNPDIMRMTTVPADDTSLTGSTYELITGTDDESWSHDGRDQDLISESVSSLDAQRTDDVQSLADTELVTDDEYTHVPDAIENTNSHYASAVSSEAQYPKASENKTIHDYDDEVESESEGEDDDQSRSSLEYAQESLKTPSIPTPEASNIYERPPQHEQAEHKNERHDHRIGYRFDPVGYVSWLVQDLVSSEDPAPAAKEIVRWLVTFTVCFVVALTFGTVALHRGPPTAPAAPAAPAVAPTTTVYVTTTAAYVAAPLATTNVEHQSPTSSSQNDRADFIPADNIEGSLRPDCLKISFSTPSNTKLVAHVPSGLKKAWFEQRKDCIDVVSTRDGRTIATTVVLTSEGVLVRFPRSEAYGVVDVNFSSQCKPTLHRVLKVHFGKGILEEVYEMTKLIANDFTEFVPVAAQEAERRLSDAKRSWIYVTDSLGNTALTVTDTMSKSLSTWLDNSREHAKKAESGVVKVANDLSTFVYAFGEDAIEYCNGFSDARLRAQSSLKLELLHTQIAARIWWLKVTGREEERAEYQRKAKDYMMAKKRAESIQLAKSGEKTNDRGSRLLGSLLRGKDAGCRTTHKQRRRNAVLAKA